MAHINELMGAGVPWRLARMLGSNRLQTVMAAGSSVDDAVQLAINFALLATSGPGQGVALDYATGAAVTALYNTGPATVLIYPAEGDSFNNQVPDQPMALGVGVTFLGVPAIDAWIVVLSGGSGGFSDAPMDGGMYLRQNGQWVLLPTTPSTPGAPTILWIYTPGFTVVPAGITRVFVAARGPVILALPAGDVLVADRGPQAGTFPITVQPPSGGTINGEPSYVMTSDWIGNRFYFDGANYGVA